MREAADAQNENAEALQRTREAFSDSFQGLAGTIGQFSSVLAQLDSVDGSLSSFGQQIVSFSQFLSVSSGTFQSLSDFAKGLSESKKYAETFFSHFQKQASVSVQSVKGLKNGIAALGPAFSALGGPVGLAVSGVAAIAAGVMAYKASVSVNDQLTDSFKVLEKRAKAAGDSIRSVGDALHYGAFQLPVSEYDAAFAKLQKTADALKKAREEAAQMTASSQYGGMGGGGFAAAYAGEAGIARAEAAQKNAWAEDTEVVKQTIATAREEQRTELDKLEEQKRIFTAILKQAETHEELNNDVEARKVVVNQIAALDKKIEEAKTREADAAIAAATAEEKHAEAVKSLDKALEKGIIDQERRDELMAKADELLADAKRREAEAKKAKTVSEIGLDAFIAAGEKEKTAREKIEEQYGKIQKAFREGAISEEQMTKARRSRKKQLDELARQEKEAAKQNAARRRQDMRSSLGVDALMDSLKSPLQKYRETMDEIATAMKSGAISREERAALENKAADDYWKKMTSTREDKTTSQRAKTELAKSVSSGSVELYLAQVKNQTANYQSRIQQTTEDLCRTCQESLYQSQQTNLYLQEMLANSGGVGVWG